MIVLGLTGSIGMGKSTVARMFAEEGVPAFDADAVVHDLQGPGGALLDAIEGAFPGTVDAKGVNRQKLGAIVLADPALLRQLEAIVHPAVEAERKRFMTRHRKAPMVLLDIPLLFEKGGWKKVDHIITVSAPAAIQRERVMARPGMTEAKFESILAKQVPDAEKRARSDFVISTAGSFEETRAQVRAIIAGLTAQADS